MCVKELSLCQGKRYVFIPVKLIKIEEIISKKKTFLINKWTNCLLYLRFNTIVLIKWIIKIGKIIREKNNY